MELSLLPGTPVLSPAGEALGYVKSVYVLKNRLSALGCADGGEEEFFLPAQKLSFSEKGVTAGRAKTSAPSGEPCPVGRAVFGRTGKFLGRCCGFDPEAGTLSARRGEATLVFPLSRAAAGDVVLISPTHEKKNGPAAKNAIRVDKTQKISAENGAHGLLGKRVKRPVEGVAEAGETVTPATLQRARENNRLLELAASTLTA